MTAAILALPGAQKCPVAQTRKRGPYPGVVKLDEVRERKKYRARQLKAMEGLRVKMIETLNRLDADIDSLRA